MAHTQVQLARGTSAQVLAYTGPAGEAVINTDDYTLAIQDGSTAGGLTHLTPGVLKPQGRLTLTSGVPVLTSDTTAAATVYYTPYEGRWCPIYNGTFWQQISFIETSLALDSNAAHTGYQVSGSLFDVFAFLNSGVFTIGTGPAWSATSTRGTGAGTTQLAMLNGVLTNAVAITLRFGNAVGNTVSVAVNEATYLGTMYATANGQTGMAFKPAAAAGGSDSILGLYNAYNRVRTVTRSEDSTTGWTYANNTTWRAANNSTANRVSWVDGLGQSFAEIDNQENIAGGALVAIGFNSTTVPSGPNAYNSSSTSLAQSVRDHYVALGFNSATALEIASSGTATFNGQLGAPYGNQQCLRASLEM